MKFDRKLTWVTLSTIMILLVVSVPRHQETAAAEFTIADELVDLAGLKVAVYYATSLNTVNASRIALIKMYEWMGAEVTVLDADQIKDGALDTGEYEILAIPGANPITMNNDLGLSGRDKVREWVRRGGSYFGICGGAMLACRNTDYNGAGAFFLLNLFNGTVKGPLGEVDGMTTLHINTSSDAADLSGMSATTSSLYMGGGWYVPAESQNMTVLATYDYNDEPCLVSSTFGTGTLCLSATHVEAEENSNRDGTDFWDTNHDPDSEWDLMKTISVWQVESSEWVEPEPTTTTDESTPTTTNNDTLPVDEPLTALLPMIAVSGVVVVIVAIVVVKRR